MSTTAKRTISLSANQAAFIDAKVRADDYAPASEVVRAGLCALRERDEAVERWLKGEVAPAYVAMRADPVRAASIENAFADIRANHARQLKDARSMPSQS